VRALPFRLPLTAFPIDFWHVRKKTIAVVGYVPHVPPAFWFGA
jgi:hypothetical protein